MVCFHTAEICKFISRILDSELVGGILWVVEFQLILAGGGGGGGWLFIFYLLKASNPSIFMTGTEDRGKLVRPLCRLLQAVVVVQVKKKR